MPDKEKEMPIPVLKDMDVYKIKEENHPDDSKADAGRGKEVQDLLGIRYFWPP
jgi:hypothetical protein